MTLNLLAQTSTDSPATIKDLEVVYASVVSGAVSLGVIVLFIMLLAGGFKYLTAGGDPKALEGAKKTLSYAIGGFIFIALSYLVLVLIESFTGAPVSTFQIVK